MESVAHDYFVNSFDNCNVKVLMSQTADLH